MGPMKLARTRGIWHIMLVQGEDKLCPYVLTGRKKNYGIRSYRGGGGELESVQAHTGRGWGQKSGECGRTYFLDGP